MKLIVGLGNPGPKYTGTRHNVGFEVVDRLAARWGVGMASEKFHAWFGLGESGGEKVALLKPTTYMNRSGQAVLDAGKFYKIELSDLLVVVDDHALPLGRLRMRKNGSSGGHNGLQDIVDRLGSEEWCRLRIGIGEPIGNPVDFVTSRFTQPEETVVRVAWERAADAAEFWIGHGPDLTMTRYNKETVRECGEDGKDDVNDLRGHP